MSVLLCSVYTIRYNFLCFLVLQEFVEMLNLKKGQKVLDVGGGIGGSAFHMAKVRGRLQLYVWFYEVTHHHKSC